MKKCFFCNVWLMFGFNSIPWIKNYCYCFRFFYHHQQFITTCLVVHIINLKYVPISKSLIFVCTLVYILFVSSWPNKVPNSMDNIKKQTISETLHLYFGWTDSAIILWWWLSWIISSECHQSPSDVISWCWLWAYIFRISNINFDWFWPQLKVCFFFDRKRDLNWHFL